MRTGEIVTRQMVYDHAYNIDLIGRIRPPIIFDEYPGDPKKVPIAWAISRYEKKAFIQFSYKDFIHLMTYIRIQYLERRGSTERLDEDFNYIVINKLIGDKRCFDHLRFVTSNSFSDIYRDGIYLQGLIYPPRIGFTSNETLNQYFSSDGYKNPKKFVKEWFKDFKDPYNRLYKIMMINLGLLGDVFNG